MGRLLLVIDILWPGDDGVSAAASNPPPSVRHMRRHYQCVVGFDRDDCGICVEIVRGGHFAADPVLEDVQRRGTVEGRDGYDGVWGSTHPLLHEDITRVSCVEVAALLFHVLKGLQYRVLLGGLQHESSHGSLWALIGIGQ